MELQKLIDLESAMDMFGGEKKLYAQMIDSYLNENPFEPQHLDQLLSEKKFEEAGTYVHKCKGSSAQLGASPLAAAGQALEDVLKGRSQGDIPSLKKTFLDLYAETAAEFRNLRTQL